MKRPDNATLLLRGNAARSRPMNVEELILSGSYKRRWYNKQMEDQAEEARNNKQVNNQAQEIQPIGGQGGSLVA